MPVPDGSAVGAVAGGLHVRGRGGDGGGAGGAPPEGAAVVPRRHVQGHQGHHAHRCADNSWTSGQRQTYFALLSTTVIILLVGLLIMIFVIPYAFSSVIKQLEAESRAEEAKANRTTTTTTTTPPPTTT